MRRRIGVRQERGRRIEPFFVDDGILRRDSLATEQPLVRTPDPIPDLEPRALRAHFLDRAGQVTGDHVGERQRRRDHSRPDVEIDRIERSGPDPHQHLPGTWLGPRQVADLDDLGASGLFDISSAHQTNPRWIDLDPDPTPLADLARTGHSVLHYRLPWDRRQG